MESDHDKIIRMEEWWRDAEQEIERLKAHQEAIEKRIHNAEGAGWAVIKIGLGLGAIGSIIAGIWKLLHG